MRSIMRTTAICAAFALAGGFQAAGAAEPKAETELGKLAASLKPGEIREFQTRGYNHDLLKSWYDWDHDASGKRLYGAQAMFHITATHFSNTAKWDPKTRQVLIIGIGHYAAMKFVAYSADRNEWTLMPVPTWCDPRSIECQVAAIL
ncbi:MAG: hypothetical protein N3A38_15790, partial [Planctomycetota bacterium]|nr:hypothetical protein [Planctomycetota bacterium]